MKKKEARIAVERWLAVVVGRMFDGYSDDEDFGEPDDLESDLIERLVTGTDSVTKVESDKN